METALKDIIILRVARFSDKLHPGDPAQKVSAEQRATTAFSRLFLPLLHLNLREMSTLSRRLKNFSRDDYNELTPSPPLLSVVNLLTLNSAN